MWKKIVTIIAIVLFVVGLALLLFAPVSNFIGNLISNSETEEFNTIVNNIEDGSYEEALEKGEIDKEGYPIDNSGKRTSDKPLVFKVDVDRLYKASKEYNEYLKENQGSLLVNEFAYENQALNLSDYGIPNGIYGYISAPTIGMKLPIYLGANEATMSYGAAHLTYTSLPVGGESTNVAIAGHTGYIGRIFFDNLRNLNEGDEITLTNFWGDLNYKVTTRKVVAENEASDIFIQKGEELLTLVTCISNSSGGFDRYLVICERV